MAIMAGSPAAGGQGIGAVAESSHLTHKQEAERDRLSLAGVFETSKSTPSYPPPNPSQTDLPTGKQISKYHSYSNHHVPLLAPLT